MVMEHLPSILNSAEVKVIVPLAPWTRTLPSVTLVLGWVPARACMVDECLHPDSADGIEEVTRADARGSTGFRHASAGAASAAAVAVTDAMVHVG